MIGPVSSRRFVKQPTATRFSGVVSTISHGAVMPATELTTQRDTALSHFFLDGSEQPHIDLSWTTSVKSHRKSPERQKQSVLNVPNNTHTPEAGALRFPEDVGAYATRDCHVRPTTALVYSYRDYVLRFTTLNPHEPLRTPHEPPCILTNTHEPPHELSRTPCLYDNSHSE